MQPSKYLFLFKKIKAMKRAAYTYLVGMLIVFSAYAQQTETRSLSSFSEISVGEAINVEIKSGDREEAIVEVRGADLDDVRTDVSGDRLKIHMRDGRNFSRTDVYVKVTYKYIDEIDVSSAADLVSVGVIEAKDLEVEVSSAGDVEIEVDVEELEVRVSSAGDLEVSGFATRQYVRVASSGDYDAYDLESKEAEVDASSAGDARIFVTESLDADARSGGSVSYRGNPEKVYADSSSGGKVRRS